MSPRRCLAPVAALCCVLAPALASAQALPVPIGPITAPRPGDLPAALQCVAIVPLNATPTLPAPVWREGTCARVPGEVLYPYVPDAAPYVPRLGCVGPSESACTNPDWLESACGRGALDAGACAPWLGAMRERFRTAAGPVTEGTTGDPSDDAFGVRATHSLHRVDARRFARSFTPSAGSYRSQVLARVLQDRALPAGATRFYDAWERDGNAMRSCLEYVHHRFYDVAHPALLTEAYEGDGRAVFNALYGPALARQSIGTRAVCAPAVGERFFSRDGALPIPAFFPRPVVVNPFKYVPPRLAEAGADTPALPRYVTDAWGRLVANRCTVATPPGTDCRSVSDQSTVTPSWVWHYNTARGLRTMLRRGPDNVDVGGEVPFQPALAPNAEHPCGGVRTHGYTDEELDHLHDLGLRYWSLVKQYEATLDPLDLEEVGAAPSAPSYGDLINPDPIDRASSLQTLLEQRGLSFVLSAPVGGAPVIRPPVLPPRVDLVRGIGGEMMLLLREAERWGCLQPGVTPCDWSPRLFARTLADRHVEDEETAFQECLQYVENAGDFSVSRPTLPVISPLGQREISYTSRSPMNPIWRVTIDLPARGAAPAAPWEYNWTRSLAEVILNLSPASSPSRMWASSDETPYNEAYLARIVDPTARQVPACDNTRFFSNSRCHDAFYMGGIARRSGAYIAEAAPELVGGDGRLHLPGRSFARAETFGDGVLGARYDLRSSYRVTGGATSASTSPGNAVFGCAGILPPSPGSAAIYAQQLDARVSTTLAAWTRLFGAEERSVIDARLDASMRGLDASSLSLFGDAVLGCTGADCAGAGAYTFGPQGSQRDQELARAEQWVTVLGIPIHVTVGVVGAVGATLTAAGATPTCDGQGAATGFVRVSATPSAGIRAFATAAVDVGVAAAGVKGEINVLTASVPTGAEVAVIPAGAEGCTDAARTEGRPCLRVEARSDLVLSTLNGRIAAYAEVDFGLYSESAERTLFSWGGMTLNRNLYRGGFTLPLHHMRRVAWRPAVASP